MLHKFHQLIQTPFWWSVRKCDSQWEHCFARCKCLCIVVCAAQELMLRVFSILRKEIWDLFTSFLLFMADQSEVHYLKILHPSEIHRTILQSHGKSSSSLSVTVHDLKILLHELLTCTAQCIFFSAGHINRDMNFPTHKPK